MLADFLRRYVVTADVGDGSVIGTGLEGVDEDLRAVIGLLGGKTFESGLYRVYRADQLVPRTQAVSRIFDINRPRAVVFAADWLGRQFAVCDSREPGSRRTVTCVDAGGADGFDTEQTIVEFHTQALVRQASAALAYPFFQEWMGANPSEIPPDKCVGYRIPLFLGGKDDLSNLELMEMGVYWHLCSELWDQVKDLPEGAPVGEITFDE